MGFAIAGELKKRGADVTLITGPVVQTINGVERVSVTSAEEMYSACVSTVYDIAVMAAAVADYMPAEKADQKIKKNGDELVLRLKRTKDILATLGERKKDGQVLVGFALETHNEREGAKKKLKEKGADLIVLNSLQDEGAGFGHDTNKATLYLKSGEEKALPLQSKSALAKEIVDTIITLL
jgi:phosphopantothenoylcysteine decarboxylase/phosphopantothenate--cysteine ligase